jgi:hypothetical protein
MTAFTTMAKKLAVAGVAGALLAGAGMTGAQAATPAATADPAGAYWMSKVTNLTPYTWSFLADTTPGFTGPYDVAPPQTVAPGQTVTWAAHDVNDHWKSFFYVFTDANGAAHTIDLEDESNSGNGPGQYLHAFSQDGYGLGAHDSTASFHMTADPDGFGRHVDAVWNTGATVRIDAAKDPASAADAVNYQLPRVPVSSVAWTATDAKPTFHQVDEEQATSKVLNYSSSPATLFTDRQTSVGESTSIGEEVSMSMSTKIFGVAAKVAETVTSEQEWTSEDSVTMGEDAPIDPGCGGWLIKDTSIASLNGTLQFTTPENVTYVVSNVAISRGDIIDPNGNLPSGMNVTATQATLGTASCTADGTATASNGTASHTSAAKG